MTQQYLLLLGFGLVDGAVLAVASVGFTLQFGATNYVNFAYGQFITFGAYAAYVFDSPPFHLNFWEIVVAAALSTGLLALCIGRFAFTPLFRRRPQLLYALVLTFATSLILDNVYLAIWGSAFHQFTFGDIGSDVHLIGPFILTTVQLGFLAASLACLALIHLMLRYTKLGRIMNGIAVAAGDVVVADDTGICFVPHEWAERVISRCEEIAAGEAKRLEDVASGLTVPELANRTYVYQYGSDHTASQSQ
jgi:branched-subunit amino acid ABC-type transport system permease component